MAANKSLRLAPARPETLEESSAYMPRLPWRWILLGALSLATVTGGFWLKEQRKAEMLRSQILRVHEQELAQASERCRKLRDKLEGWIVNAARKRPDNWVDKRLRIPGLRSGNGLYLRLPVEAALDKDKLALAAAFMKPDAIPKCLGLSPASARGLYEKGSFLLPEWIEETRTDDSVMSLRVTDTILSRHIRNDLPSVLNMLRSDWFLLVLQLGENRRDDPVDVFLWDLRSDKQLLRARIQARGVLLPMRIASEGASRGAPLAPDRITRGAANDCSIGAQLKAMTGLPVAEIASEVPGWAQGPDGAASKDPAGEGLRQPVAESVPVEPAPVHEDRDSTDVSTP